MVDFTKLFGLSAIRKILRTDHNRFSGKMGTGIGVGNFHSAPAVQIRFMRNHHRSGNVGNRGGGLNGLEDPVIVTEGEVFLTEPSFFIKRGVTVLVKTAGSSGVQICRKNNEFSVSFVKSLLVKRIPGHQVIQQIIEAGYPVVVMKSRPAVIIRVVAVGQIDSCRPSDLTGKVTHRTQSPRTDANGGAKRKIIFHQGI